MSYIAKIITDGDMSGNITSAAFRLGKHAKFSVQLAAPSATHVGSAALQGSNDYEKLGASANWNEIPLSSGNPAAANGTAFNALINVPDAAYAYGRIVYTATSGAGTLQASLAKKE